MGTKRFNSAIETTYGLLFFGSVVFMSIGIWEGFAWNSDKWGNNIIILCMLLVLFAQMLRIYNVLHELDDGSNNSDHFINLVQGRWVVYERFLRLFLALIVILAVKYQNPDEVSLLSGGDLIFLISGWIQLLSQFFPGILGENYTYSYSKESFVLAYYSLLMLVIYLAFWIWDLFIYLSAKIVLAELSSEQNIRNQAQSFIEYLRPKELSEGVLRVTKGTYQEKLNEIIEENTFSYFSSKKFYERLVGFLFFLSTLLFIFANGNNFFLFFCGGLTFLFIHYNRVYGSILRGPYELVLSVFKTK